MKSLMLRSQRRRTGLAALELLIVLTVIVAAARHPRHLLPECAPARPARRLHRQPSPVRRRLLIIRQGQRRQGRLVLLARRGGPRLRRRRALRSPGRRQPGGGHHAPRGNRPDIQPITTWLPHILYTHLVLIDYLDQELPAKWVVSPGDVTRLAWQRDPVNFDALPTSGRPSGASGNIGARWPYSSSYETPPPSSLPTKTEGSAQTVTQAAQHNQYNIPAGDGWLGRRLLSEIAFPSQKAMTYESVQRFFGPRQAFCLYQEARVPVMTADGSASIRTTSFTNQGFNPNTPTSPLPTTTAYTPDLNWESATLNGTPAENVLGFNALVSSGPGRARLRRAETP